MKVFPFLKYKYLSTVFSVACIIAGFGMTVAHGGFNLGLDFQAGISQRVSIDSAKAKASIEQVRASLKGLEGNQIQNTGSPANQEYIIKVKQSGDSKTFSEEMSKKISETLEKSFGTGTVKVLQTEYVGPRFSSDLAAQAFFLTGFALVLIMLYCWFRFKLGYAVAAIAATLHDTLFMISVIGAFQLEVSTATVAAVLTIIGYSLNDTIVVFDRIRENQRLMREGVFSFIIDSSISQTLSRTIITSLTTLLAIVAIYIFGTGEVQLFALNMIVGIVVGTYSSIFIAAPVLYGWVKRSAGRKGQVLETAPAAGVPEPPKSSAGADETAESGEVPEADTEEQEEDAGEDDDSSQAKKEFGAGRMSREQRKRKARKL